MHLKFKIFETRYDPGLGIHKDADSVANKWFEEHPNIKKNQLASFLYWKR